MKKICLGFILLACSISAHAQPLKPMGELVFGVNYINLSSGFDNADGVDLDFNLSGIVGSVGYKIKGKDNIFIIPEVRLGTGIVKDTVTYRGINIDVELDQFISVSVKGQFELNNQGLYFFVAPAYTNMKFSAQASANGQTKSDSHSEWKFGLGGGLGFQVAKNAAAELSYETYTGFEGLESIGILSLGAKFQF